MKSRRKIVLGLPLVILCAALAAAFWPEKPEPVYKGRKLSGWLDNITFYTAPPSIPLQTQEAVKAMGSNAIPFYLEWMFYELSMGKRAKFGLERLANHWLDLNWYPADDERFRASQAWAALMFLGTNAEPAVPRLVSHITRVEKARSSEAPTPAIQVLVSIGHPAVPAYLALMRNSDARVRAWSVLYANALHQGPLISAQLKKSLDDPDEQVRANARIALSRDEERTPNQP